jgi:Icc-related predicted phosphoesterase
MKILAVSDLHGDAESAKRLAKEAEKEKVDMILVLGDISVFGDLEKGMIGPFVATKKRVAFVSGNHDMPGIADVLVEKYKITDLEHEAFVYRHIGVFGSGGSNVGPNYVDDKEIFDNLSNGFRYVSGAERTIMATHIHPSKSLIEKFSFPGSKAVRKAIDKFKPDIHICGHIHEMEGFEERIGKTIVFSVGKRGKIIEI